LAQNWLLLKTLKFVSGDWCMRLFSKNPLSFLNFGRSFCLLALGSIVLSGCSELFSSEESQKNVEVSASPAGAKDDKDGPLGMRRICPSSSGVLRVANEASAKAVLTLSSGSLFEMLQVSPRNQWVKVRYQGKTGWLNPAEHKNRGVICNASLEQYVCSASASFRAANSPEAKLIRMFEEGERVRFEDFDVATGLWTLVADKNGTKGWVMSKHLCDVSSARFRNLNSGWQVPTNAFCSSDYGYRIHPISGTYRFHSGIDFAADEGALLKPVDAGVVTFSGWVTGYGNVVEIKHIVQGQVVFSFYAHLSAIAAFAGDTVTKGTIIGRIGSTGNSTGPHLHLEALNSAQEPLDPKVFFKKDLGC
jgi:murein DD-endopeptidase MepM/ murein hydrolase activator NlpD